MKRNSTLAHEAAGQFAQTGTRKQLPREERRRRPVDTEQNDDFDGGPGRPTVERIRHDPIYEVNGPPLNEDESDHRPMRVKDRWQRMEDAGAIDGSMRRAIDRFRRSFLFAGLETLRASPLLRLARSTRASDPSEHRLDARKAVWSSSTGAWWKSSTTVRP